MPWLELPVFLAGRRVRPVALGLTLWNIGAAWSILAPGVWWGWTEVVLLGGFAVAILAFLAGWLLRSNTAEVVGLLLTFFNAVGSAAFLALLFGFEAQVLTVGGVAVVAAGSFWLERLVPPPPHRVNGRTRG